MRICALAIDNIMLPGDNITLLELGDSTSYFINPNTEVFFIDNALQGFKMLASPTHSEAHAENSEYWQYPSSEPGVAAADRRFHARAAYFRQRNSHPGFPLLINIVEASVVRKRLSDYLTSGKILGPITLEVCFGVSPDAFDLKFKLSVLLQNLFEKLQKPHVVVNGCSMHYALTSNKVLFWLFCQQFGLPTPATTLIDLEQLPSQERDINRFTKVLRREYVLVKPTNATLTLGVVVVKKEKVYELLQAMQGAKADHTEMILLETLSTLNDVNRDPLLRRMFAYGQFIKYWSSPDRLGDKRFCLVQEYVPCETSAARFGAMIFSENPKFNYTIVDGYLKKRLRPNTDRAFDPLAAISQATYGQEGSPDSSNAFQSRCAIRVDELEPAQALCDINKPDERRVFDRRFKEKLFADERKKIAGWMCYLNEKFADWLRKQKSDYPTNHIIQNYLNSEHVTHLILDEQGFCWNCFKITPNKILRKCGGCKTAQYCDEGCQKTDWSANHNRECPVIKIQAK